MSRSHLNLLSLPVLVACGLAAGPASATEPALDAATVCAAVTMSASRLQHMQGIAGREYTASELTACLGMTMGDQKRDCMLASGRVPAAPAPAPAPAPSPAPSSPPTSSFPTRKVWLQNFNASPVTRVVWRFQGDVPFRPVPLPRPVEKGSSGVDLVVGAGAIDLCYELAGSAYVLVTVRAADDLASFLVPPVEQRQKPGTCVDTL